MIQPFKEVIVVHFDTHIPLFHDEDALFVCVEWLLLRTSNYDVIVIVEFVKGGEILGTFDLIAFFEGCQHDN